MDATNVSEPDMLDSNSKNVLEFSIEAADDALMRLSNEFPPIIEPDGDTLVYLGIPGRLDSQSDAEYQHIEKQFSRPFLLHSERLRALHSSKFEHFLGPMSARVERRLKKLGVHRYLPGSSVKYYIDLSPALNDEEALILLTELSVPHSALAWHGTATKLNVPASHVCGRDDLSFVPTLSIKKVSSKVKPVRQLLQNTTEGDAGAAQQPSSSPSRRPVSPKEDIAAGPITLEEEYSALRHHTALARLLYAVAGQDPKLNSAAKMWSFCMVAKYFECSTHNDITVWISSWILEKGNCHFIQYLPDVSYQIATAIQATWLMKCAFTILVGQQALVDNLPMELRKDQPHAAKLLDDDDINRVDHASAALAARIKSAFETLVVYPGLWNVSSKDKSEMHRLLNFARDLEDCQDTLYQVKTLLKHYIQRMIYMTLSHQYDHSLQQSVPPFAGFRAYSQYVHVPRQLRPLTQQFWHILRLEDLSRDYADTDKNKDIWRWTQESLREEGIIAGDEIPYVSRKELVAAIDKLNELSAAAATPAADINPFKRVKISEPSAESVEQAQIQGFNFDLPFRSREPADDWVQRSPFVFQAGPSKPSELPAEPSTPPRNNDSAQGRVRSPRTPVSDMASFSILDDAVSEASYDFLDSEIENIIMDEKEHKSLAGGPSKVPLTVADSSRNVSIAPPPCTDMPDLPETEPETDTTLKVTRKAEDWNINPRWLLQELQVYLYDYLNSMIQPGYVVDRTCDFDIPTGHICTMLCLSEGEYKYLPLWAGGLDDGSGGVFNDGVEPPDAPEVAHGGFRGGAMGIIPGVGSVTDPSVSGAGSEFEDVRTESAISTIGKASRWATNGTATETVMSMEE